MREELHKRWFKLLDSFNVDSNLADESFERICQHYSEPGRAYHTLDHVLSMLRTLEALDMFITDRNQVQLSAWLHDVVYDSKASDNEERSAQFAEKLCETLSIPLGSAVAALILKTKTHEPGDDSNARALLDADLAILGSDEASYREYAAQIRREYAWVPEPDYRVGRQRVLAKFLERDRIFHFLTALEAPTRRNLANEIAMLQ